MNGEARPAFYALTGGGWRDYVTLLHPPYTLWHLSYVAIGAALLGVPCRFHDNSYGKNEAVYRQSIAGWFSTVRFVRDASPSPNADAKEWRAREQSKV